ncbi:MAG: hypothetical protein HOV84_17505 [Streptomyces sp.]|nr:hypothetical protein [Streptomyces sp.]
MPKETLPHHTSLRYDDEEAGMIAAFQAQFPGMSRNLAIRTLLRYGFRESGIDLPDVTPSVPEGQTTIEDERTD